MAVKHHHTKRGSPKFYPQRFTRWLGLLTIILGMAGFGMPFAPRAWAALAPSPVAVDSAGQSQFQRV